MKRRNVLTSKAFLLALASVLILNLPAMAQNTSLHDIQDLQAQKYQLLIQEKYLIKTTGHLKALRRYQQKTWPSFEKPARNLILISLLHVMKLL